jgi:hypothetical protein
MQTPQAWRARIACLGVPHSVFFPLELPGRRSSERDPFLRARAVCAACSVRRECFRDALAQGDLDGFRAGLTPDELKHAARARREAQVSSC